MRTLRDVVCLLVAVGSVALAAVQPDVAPLHDQAGTASSGLPWSNAVHETIDRAVLSAPLSKA